MASSEIEIFKLGASPLTQTPAEGSPKKLCASAPPRDISSALDISRRDAETQRLLELGASPQTPDPCRRQL